MVGSPTANAGDTGSIPGPKIPHAREQLSLKATTTEVHMPRAYASQQEKELQ